VGRQVSTKIGDFLTSLNGCNGLIASLPVPVFAMCATYHTIVTLSRYDSSRFFPTPCRSPFGLAFRNLVHVFKFRAHRIQSASVMCPSKRHPQSASNGALDQQGIRPLVLSHQVVHVERTPSSASGPVVRSTRWCSRGCICNRVPEIRGSHGIVQMTAVKEDRTIGVLRSFKISTAASSGTCVVVLATHVCCCYCYYQGYHASAPGLHQYLLR
jgi:hypothetical protein